MQIACDGEMAGRLFTLNNCKALDCPALLNVSLYMCALLVGLYVNVYVQMFLMSSSSPQILCKSDRTVVHNVIF